MRQLMISGSAVFLFLGLIQNGRAPTVSFRHAARIGWLVGERVAELVHGQGWSSGFGGVNGVTVPGTHLIRVKLGHPSFFWCAKR